MTLGHTLGEEWNVPCGTKTYKRSGSDTLLSSGCSQACDDLLQQLAHTRQVALTFESLKQGHTTKLRWYGVSPQEDNVLKMWPTETVTLSLLFLWVLMNPLCATDGRRRSWWKLRRHRHVRALLAEVALRMYQPAAGQSSWMETSNSFTALDYYRDLAVGLQVYMENRVWGFLWGLEQHFLPKPGRSRSFQLVLAVYTHGYSTEFSCQRLIRWMGRFWTVF